jgi:PAS domain S-box-containing protein
MTSEVSPLEESRKALLASEIRYRRLFETAKDGILILDAETGLIDDVNPFLIELLGYSRDQCVSKNIWDIGFLHDIIANKKKFLELKENRYVRYENLPLETAKGRKIEVEFVSNVYREKDKLVIQCNIRDNTERKKTEERINHQAGLLENVYDAIIATDMNYTITYWNKAAEKLYGWKTVEVIGRPFEMFIANEYLGISLEEIHRKIYQDGFWKGELTQNRRDGIRMPVLTTLSHIVTDAKPPSGFIAVNRDLTEKHRLLETARLADKMDTIGVLAGGIAHDFNNLLGGFFGYVELAKSTCSAGSETVEYLDKALEALTHARDLTRQLLTFAKGGSPDCITGQISSLVKETTQFALSGSEVIPEFHFAGDLRLCDFDNNQLAQVVSNLVLNAVQAMPLGGTITITAENITGTHAEVPHLPEGTYVHVSIADTGVGIPPDIQARIFDPFFTTKKKGNGLGLAMVYSIIRNHNGNITVESEPGKGTIFNFYLPASDKKATTFVITGAEPFKGAGTVLVMDDDVSIRETTGSMLEAMGYSVEYASDGSEALEMIHTATARKEPFSAVLMDLTIPGGMGGKEAIKHLRKTEKELKVFVSSGYSDDTVMAHPTDYGFTDRIGKPFIKNELAGLFCRHFEGDDPGIG